MRIFAVGGSVRDQLLGREVVDRDYVVVGATPQQMIDQGFKYIEATQFPVFLHPDTGDEYALARTERKTGHGYHGFETNHDPSVTIEEDLARRDLTINSLAFPYDEGNLFRYKSHSDLIDPFGGYQDLQNGILRHVSDAFQEDPLRVLRVARFAARYDFDVASETMELMHKMCNDGELDHLVPERVWMEWTKAMTEQYPSRFFWVLQVCGALRVLFPELEKSLAMFNPIVSKASLRQATATDLIALTFVKTSDRETRELLARYGAPNVVTTTVHDFHKILAILDFASNTGGWLVTIDHVFDLLYAIKAFQHPDRLFEVVKLIDHLRNDRYARRVDTILRVFHVAKQITFKSLPIEQRNSLKGAEVGQAIHERRREATKWMV